MFYARWWKFRWQKLTRGWSDGDTWNLDHTIAEFVLPRLERFKEIQHGIPYPLTEKQWDEVIDKMMFSFQVIIDEWNFDVPDMTPEETKEHWARVEEGLNLFGTWFRDLWD